MRHEFCHDFHAFLHEDAVVGVFSRSLGHGSAVVADGVAAVLPQSVECEVAAHGYGVGFDVVDFPAAADDVPEFQQSVLHDVFRLLMLHGEPQRKPVEPVFQREYVACEVHCRCLLCRYGGVVRRMGGGLFCHRRAAVSCYPGGESDDHFLHSGIDGIEGVLYLGQHSARYDALCTQAVEAVARDDGND